MRTCTVAGCERKHVAYGYCQTHADRYRRRGTTELLGREYIRTPVGARFDQVGWDVVLRIPELGPCWEWQGGVSTAGYGRLVDDQHRHLYAHRFAYERRNGPIPDGLFVCHRCDNPRCVNPEHLELGTPMKNSQDKLQRHRQTRGTAHPSAKLTDDDARAIRALIEGGVLTQRQIARRFGVTPSLITRVKQRKLWAHVV